jgi:hypothetical protein
MSLFEHYCQAYTIWPVNPFKKCANKYSTRTYFQNNAEKTCALKNISTLDTKAFGK